MKMKIVSISPVTRIQNTSHRLLGSLLLVSALSALVPSDPAEGAGFHSPQECVAYTGDAHLNCLYAYIEIQQGTIAKLEEELKTLKATPQQLQDQVNQQASVTGSLQRTMEAQEKRLQEVPQIRVIPFVGFSYHYGPPSYFGRAFIGPCYGPWYPCW